MTASLRKFASCLLVICCTCSTILQAQPVSAVAPGTAVTAQQAAKQIIELIAAADSAMGKTQYELAAARLTDAYNLLELANDEKLERNVLNSLATLYYNNNQLQLAGQYYRKLISLDEKSGDLQALSVSYFNLGHVVASQKQFDAAQKLFQQAQVLSHKLNDKSGEAYANKALGVNAQALGDMPLAQSLLMKAEQQFVDLRDDKQRAAVLRNLADVTLLLQQPKQAIVYYQQAIPLLLDAGLNSAVIRCYRGLSQAYEQINEYITALKMQRTYSNLLQAELEQISNESSQRMREELDLRHYMDSNTKLERLSASQQGLLEQRAHMLQLQMWVLILVLALAVSLGYMLWRGTRTARILHSLATTDELTGAFNRRAIMEAGRQEWLRAKRYVQPVTCLTFDVDHFKSINDTYGHATGDVVLKALTATIADMMRQTDTLGRIGGEEFLLVAGNTDLLQAQSLAERIRLQVAALAISELGDRRVTISIGLAGYQQNLSFEQTVQLADKALYHAKRSGRNRSSVYHSGIGQVPVVTGEQPQLKLVEAGGN